jgi:hypothetical protein
MTSTAIDAAITREAHRAMIAKNFPGDSKERGNPDVPQDCRVL